MLEPMLPIEKLHEDIFVARQPIFDKDRSLWGYELLFRDSGSATAAKFEDPDQATARVIADGYVLARASLAPDVRTLINFPERLLLSKFAQAMSPESCVVEILASVSPSREVLTALGSLRLGGYTVALDDYAGQEHLDPFLVVAQVVKVDFAKLGHNRRSILRIAQKLRQPGRLLLAEKVETPADFDFARMLGFSLFQGFFFATPEVIPGRKITSAEAARLQLLRELGKDDFDVRRLTAAIEQDVSLTYRLFRFINSAMFSPGMTVDSVERAVVLLGRRQLAQWLRVVLLTDTAQTPSARELVYFSACRARFLDLLCKASEACAMPSEPLFLLGMFSLLDALLGQPMAEALAHMPLPPGILEALVEGKGDFVPWLNLAVQYERHDWQQVVPLLAAARLDFQAADRLYVQAQAWAEGILHSAAARE
ncbi:MAG: HDOD domain-containing protein [Thermodesulfobacteriota bacterium]